MSRLWLEIGAVNRRIPASVATRLVEWLFVELPEVGAINPTRMPEHDARSVAWSRFNRLPFHLIPPSRYARPPFPAGLSMEQPHDDFEHGRAVHRLTELDPV